MIEDTPLIWTIKGNVPVADLEYKAEWEFHEDRITFRERYTLEGELVKENAHICFLRGHSLAAEGGRLN